MPNGTEGVAKFFAGLGAGPALRQQAAARGRLDAMRMALEDAQIRNTGNDAALKQIELDSLDPATLAASFAGAGVPQDRAAGAAGLQRAGNNASQISALVSAMNELAAHKDAQAAAIRGDQNLANANLFGVANGPVDLSSVQDGVAFNKTVTPDKNAFTPTAVGQSMIAQRDAAAANSYASANATTQKLPDELKKIQADAAKAIGKPVNVTLPAIGQIRGALGVPNGGTDEGGNTTYSLDPQTMGRFLAFQGNNAATDPRYNDGDYALQQFLIKKASPDVVSLPEGAAASPDDGPTPAITPAAVSQALASAAPPGSGPVPAAATKAVMDAVASKTADTSAPKQPATQAEFNALPSGTMFINPADGRLMRKK